jgi:hypothetical protein
MSKYAILLIFSTLSLLQAQQVIDYFEMDFLRGNTEWAWQGKGRYNRHVENGFSVRLNDNFSSTLFVASPGNPFPRWRDENRLNSFIYYQSQNLLYGLYANSWLLKDKGRIVSQAANYAAGFRAEYQPIRNIVLTPYTGYQKSQNRSRIDWGWDLGLTGHIREINLGEYRTEMLLRTEYDFFRERQNSTNALNIRIATDFSPSSKDTLVLQYENDRKQFYSSDGTQLVDVQIENKSLQNILDYNLSQRSAMRFHTILSDRSVVDNSPGDVNRRNEFVFENRLNYRYISRSVFLEMGFHTSFDTQNSLGLRVDNETLQTGLYTLISYQPTESDYIDLQLSYVKYQYDTPEINNDDRDELRFVGLLSHRHVFSQFIHIVSELYTKLYHKIYILKEQSANNNWNRVFRLDVSVHYKNNKIRNKFHTQVLANYTVFDFDDLFDQAQSFVFRKYMVADSLVIPLYRDYYLGLYGRVELDDRGNFIEQLFSQKLIESSETVFYDIQIRKMLLYLFRWEIGIAFYRRQNWRHISKKQKIGDNTKTSPYIRVVYPLNQNLKIGGHIAFHTENNQGGQKSKYTIGHLNMYYNF